MTTAVGGGLGGADWSIVDPSTPAPGTTLVGGMSSGSSDYLTPAMTPTGTPLTTAYAQQTASTVVAPYGTPAANAQPYTMIPFATSTATRGQQALGGGTAATTPATGQDRVLYAHVAAPAAKPGPAPAPAPSKELEVKGGDTLSKLAQEHGTTWERLYELNKDVIGGDPNLIKPGQKLKLP